MDTSHVIESFLHTLFGDALAENRRLAIFTLPDKRTRHFSSLNAAALYAAEAAKRGDVYFGVGLSGASKNARDCGSDIVALVALWADIDFAMPYRAGKPLPKTLQEAHSLLEKLPFAPSITVHSGGGLYPLWLLKEPWILDTQDERQRAARIAKGWHGLICAHAETFGWNLENLGDLARVLRVPGTFNRKSVPAVEVRVIEEHLQRRYNPSDFEPFCDTEIDSNPPAVDLHLHENAQPPFEKFGLLAAQCPAFLNAWERRRPELKDQSQSGYDLCLANIAALNGWTDQEIADLIIAVRRKHNQNPHKALREDYMARTIQCARSGAATQSTEGVDLSALLAVPEAAEVAESKTTADPGPMPEELLRVPGFISEVMDHSLMTAPYPSPVLAFCGALALQAFLAGRKVCDPGDNRTNLYLLGLAHSAAGKDWPRKVNTRILHTIGLSGSLGDRFASGEGIQDALFVSPAMLFQTDEIDGLLQSINKAKDARHENIMSTLLTMYSSANSVFPMRRKAGLESPGVIDQPCLVVFGTAIPNHYYGALSERMLTNGFFARTIILENARRGRGQEPRALELPPRVLDIARWWAEFRPGPGNLERWHPVPLVVEHGAQAKPILIDARQQAEDEYTKSEEGGDSVGTTVWGRVNEQIRKLALIHAVSANHQVPNIDAAAAAWASRFVSHLTRRMLFMAEEHVSETGFQANCKKLLAVLRTWRDANGSEWMPFWKINRKLPWSATEHEIIRTTLINQKRIEYAEQRTCGTPQRMYRLSEPIAAS